jgi:hypothetical protein
MRTDPQPAAPLDPEQKVRVTIELSQRTIAFIDSIRTELGFRSRGFIIEKLLDELIIDHEGDRRSELRTGLRWWSPLVHWYGRLRHRWLSKD